MAANTGVSILNLPELLQGLSNTYLAVAYTDPVSGQANTKKISISNLFGNTFVQSISAITNTTPANSTSTVVNAGVLFCDNNFLYVATSNNIIKRVALSSF